MAYKVIILYRLYMPPYFLGTFTEYPYSIYWIRSVCRSLAFGLSSGYPKAMA